jgi:hypothetical protein
LSFLPIARAGLSIAGSKLTASLRQRTDSRSQMQAFADARPCHERGTSAAL